VAFEAFLQATTFSATLDCSFPTPSKKLKITSAGTIALAAADTYCTNDAFQ